MCSFPSSPWGKSTCYYSIKEMRSLSEPIILSLAPSSHFPVLKLCLHKRFAKLVSHNLVTSSGVSFQNRWMMRICCLAQETQTWALCQLAGVGWEGRWEGGSGGRSHMYTYGWFVLRIGRNSYPTTVVQDFKKRRSRWDGLREEHGNIHTTLCDTDSRGNLLYEAGSSAQSSVTT